MYILVDSTSGSEWRRLLPILKRSGCKPVAEETAQEWLSAVASSSNAAALDEKREKLFGSANGSPLLPVTVAEPDSQIGAVLGLLGEARLLLFYTRPESALVHAMANGSSPTDKLKRWRDSAIAILEVYQRNRQRAVLINVESALENQADFCKIFSDNFGIDCNVQAADIKVPVEQSSLHRLIAAQMVSQAEDVQDLINELETSSIPIGPCTGTPGIDCERIYLDDLDSGSAQAKEAFTEKYNDLQEENELILLQLRQLQEELESYYLETHREIAKRTEIEKKLANEANKRHRLENEFREARKSLDRKARELTQAQNTLSMVVNSISWRLTRPLRVIRRLIAGQPLT